MANNEFATGPKVSLLLSSVVISLLIAELIVGVLTPFPITKNSNKVDHPRLKYVLNDSLYGVDQNGFRNPDFDPPYDFVGIGDSHTAGRNVSGSKSWPNIVGKMSGRSSYSMSVGSYNIYDYLTLFRMAVRYDPEYIIVGLYIPNDLEYENCKSATVSFLNNYDGLSSEFDQACEKKLKSKKWHSQKNNSSDKKSSVQSFKEFLKHSAVISSIDYFIWDPLQKLAPVRLFLDNYVRNREFHQVKVADERKLSININRIKGHREKMNLKDPLTRAILADGFKIFETMKSIAAENDIKIGALIIPSKQRVYYRLANRRTDYSAPKWFNKAIQRERALVNKFSNFFEKEDINHIDVAPSLVHELSLLTKINRRMYPVNNGHPYFSGYKIYAQNALNLFPGL